MRKASHRRPSARLIVALLGLGALGGCNSCTEAEVNEARDLVGQVLDRLDRLNSMCADDVQVTALAGGRIRFTPVVRNPREPTSGSVRLAMTVSAPGRELSTPRPHVQLDPATSYRTGLNPVADPRASLTVEPPSEPGAVTYVVETKVWAPFARAPDAEGDPGCHIRQTEYRAGQ